MTVKEYLEQAGRLENLIEREQYECRRLEDLATSLRSPAMTERVDGSRENYAAYTRALEKLQEEQERLEEHVLLLVDLQIEVGRVLAQVKTPEGREVLQLRYLERLSWPKISRRVHISRTTVINYAKAAMEQITLPPDAIDLGRL